ncbi:MAG: ECF transporter S component [Firmicutes bacterium]|jgi:niacin transporter|nr:ECF transporter S component [Bacillota bacterium]NLO65299.1 ECF transporter S component [Bacillota bacterium]
MRLTVKELLYGALLTAVALAIPLAFQGWLQIAIPPFSATLGSHLPSLLAMSISPWVAALVGLGSTLGFLVTLGPIVAARAFIHVFFGVIGAHLYRRGLKFWQVLLLVLPIHALGEALITMPFGFDFYQALVVVGIGTALHHILDSGLTLVLYRSLVRAGVPLQKTASSKGVVGTL